MMNYNEISDFSIKIIKRLNKDNIPCTALTKGILPKELAELDNINSYGITLVSLNEDYRMKYEPNAAAYKDRIAALKYLHDKGINTWVSVEPYPTPNIIEQDLDEILNAISFVDKIIFGRTNYSKIVSQYKQHKQFYNDLAYRTIDFCEKNDIEYHIKEKTISE